MVPEAPMEQIDGGSRPAGDGWFILNARDGVWLDNEKFGKGVTFESDAVEFPHYGINIQVVWPGQPNCYYHAEEGQEDFLVLSGECLLLIEGQERRLRAWDFVLPIRDGAHPRRRRGRAVRLHRHRRPGDARRDPLYGLQARPASPRRCSSRDDQARRGLRERPGDEDRALPRRPARRRLTRCASGVTHRPCPVMQT
jgi:hypothetical protein